MSEYLLKPIYYEYNGHLYYLNGEIIVTTNYENEDLHTIDIKNFENENYSKIRIQALSDELLAKMQKKKIQYVHSFSTKITTRENEEAYILFGFKNNKIVQVITDSPNSNIKFEHKKAYCLAQKIAQITMQQNIASPLIINNGLEALAKDLDKDLIKRYY